MEYLTIAEKPERQVAICFIRLSFKGFLHVAGKFTKIRAKC